ncbi:DUF6114 domain-containing protein [Nocardioides sp.]|uniref:DUF6114 domain-containing protein n=1 Tax=Nocardioides sp. TaxID=35761 RepID=UPI002BAC421A|nr:DUF6114 domain-containing protein [Nocardioides sp.]HVX52892.1 DUF6114 domain-containing protein [Nocardioides sp.]
MSDSLTIMSETAEPSAPAPRGGIGRRALRRLNLGRRWFRAWRRTRPFWGGVWTILAGLEIVKAMSFSIGLALTGGWSYAAGYVMGGGLILFGLVAWFAPTYKGLAGFVAFLVALAAFPTANLGGYLLGSVLGIIGASMIWSWGPKRPSKRQLRKMSGTVTPGSSGHA